MIRIAPIVLTILSGSSAGTATLKWNASTKFTNGQTITTAVTYDVFRGIDGQPKKLLVKGLTGLKYVEAIAAGKRYCYQVTANVVGYDPSARSNQGCKKIPL